jgi:5-formyltetrahydrofolate cyclo-ligase
MNLKPQKDALRAEVLARRSALSPTDRAERSARITAALLDWEGLVEAETVLLFASFGSEVETHDLRARLLDRGHCVLLPRVQRETRTLDLYEVMGEPDELVAGTWGILEPCPGRCRLVSPRDVDFVLVPGVAFDLEGHRMGYGGGFYDDLLARLAPRLPRESVVAVAFELQILESVPARAKDIPVPFIITEQRVIRANL